MGYSVSGLWESKRGVAEAVQLPHPMIFAMIAKRPETPILIIARRRKALTVLGLISMWTAISLQARPRAKYVTTSRSLSVK
jgi:hypothetical protein